MPPPHGDELAISIVIETANTRAGEYDDVVRTIDALSKQSIPRSSYEILVVVNPDVHPELGAIIARHAPDVRIIEAPATHFFGQKNVGANAAAAPIVGFVDSDCTPTPRWAEAVLDAFSRHGAEMAAVQGPLSMDPGWLPTAFRIRNFSHQQGDSERRIPSLAVCNCGLRRAELVDEPFGEIKYFHGSEVRKVAKLTEEGRFVLLVPGATCHHRFDPPTLSYFLSRGAYWGYCFLALRRDAPPSVPYTRFVRSAGVLAPVALVPAKALLDIRRLVHFREHVGVGVAGLLGASAALALSAVASGYGAYRFLLGLSPPRF